jgi:hypothetical protein
MAGRTADETRRRQWHVDRINSADDDADRVSRALALAGAELKRCAARRPGDAPGLRRQLAYMIAAFALDIHKMHPKPEFLEAFPALPGGGWVPKPNSDARHPRDRK